MLRKDKEATIAQHFEDRRSYVCLDGREVLHGKDWEARKYMVWCRGKGKCEWSPTTMKEALIVCRYDMDDPHHIKPRSKGRDDRLENLIGLCRYHHNLLDKRKPRWSKRSAA